MQNCVVLIMLSSFDQSSASQRQGDVPLAATAPSGHVMQPKAMLSKAAKGEVVVFVVLPTLLVIVCPVSWQVRGARLPTNPLPVSQRGLQVLPMSEA